MPYPESYLKRRMQENILDNQQMLYVISKEQILEYYNNITREDVASGARTIAENAATGKDLVTLTKMVRDLGFKGRVYEKIVKGKTYVIFKGLPGQRHIFTGTRYLNTNAKIIDMAIGKAAVKASVRSGARLTILYTVPIIVIEHVLKDEFLLSDLFADLAVSMVKVGLSSIVAAIAATAVGTVTTVAAAPLAVAIFVGFAASWSLDKLDQKYGIADKLGGVLRQIEDSTIGAFERSLWELERTLRWQIMNGISPGKGIFYP